MTQDHAYRIVYHAIIARYPAVAGQGHLLPDQTLRRMIAELRRAGDLWPWIPEWINGDVTLTWGLAQPPHPCWHN